MDFMDLHVHSHYSDGVNAPSENIELAKKIGLRAVTLSDHDTVKGMKEAEARAKELGIEFVRGIEISTFHNDCKSIHMLGLMWVDEMPFYPVEEMVAKSRNIRNVEIYKKLKELYGYEIDLNETKSYSKSTIVGRGQLSRALVDKGYAKNFTEADEKIKTAKVSMSYGINIEDAIKSVHLAKGLAVMAHPCSLKKDDETLFKKLKYLKDDCGLDGIECFHTKHSPEQISMYLSFAKKLDMCVSGGSDYHGAYHADIALGKGRHSDFFVPYDYLNEMKEYYGKKY